MQLDKNSFINIVDGTPLPAIDLIIFDLQGRMLVGKRKNEPAKGKWFVPGGRIKKGETVARAIENISDRELGIKLNKGSGKFIGVFDHEYTANFAEVENIKTQYITLGYEFQLSVDSNLLPKDEHSEWCWVDTHNFPNLHKNAAIYLTRSPAIDKVAYEILNTRRDNFNTLVWQTPVLSLVAQAFLFSVILNGAFGSQSRMIASLLAIITAVASVQLLVKHRANEYMLAIMLEQEETQNGWFPANKKLLPHVFPPRKWLNNISPRLEETLRTFEHKVSNLSSYDIWLAVLSAFGIAALIALVVLTMRIA